jgi:hypothetical protein
MKRRFLSTALLYLLLISLGENVEAQSERRAQAAADVVNGFVVSITVLDGGAGYTIAPIVTVRGDGEGAEAVAIIREGAVVEIIVTNAGRGYNSLPEIVVANPVRFADGLVAYFPFSGDARDHSGNKNDGTVQGALLVPDRFGIANSAFRFDGVDDHIAVQSSMTLQELGKATVSFWFTYEAQAVQEFHSPISKYRATVETGTDGFYCYVWDEGIVFTFGAANHPPEIGLNFPLLSRSGEWFHFLATYGDGEQRVYFNGVLVNSDRRNAQLSNVDPLIIGSYNPSQVPPRPFTGQVDDVRIYNRSLGPGEVAELYSHEAPSLPALQVRVRTVEIIMALIPGRRYQLRASSDLKNWTDIGESFLATSNSEARLLDVADVGRFFRLVELAN